MTRKDITSSCAGIFNNEFDEYNAVSLAIGTTNEVIEEIVNTIKRNHSWVGKILLLEELEKEILSHRIKD